MTTDTAVRVVRRVIEQKSKAKMRHGNGDFA